MISRVGIVWVLQRFRAQGRKILEELRSGIGSKEYVIATYGEDAEGYFGAKLDSGKGAN